MAEFLRNKYEFSKSVSVLDVSLEAIKLREKQIFLLEKELFLYKVLLSDLVKNIPTQNQRNLLLNIAYFVIDNPEILERFQKKRMIPFRIISKHTHIKASFLDYTQEYIVAYIVILSNPNYKTIQDYIRVQYTEDKSKDKDILLELKPEDECFGMVIKKNKRSNIILTSDGRVEKVKKTDEPIIGVEVKGVKKKGIKNLGVKIAIIVIFLLFLAYAAYREYNTPISTVVINTTSDIKLEVNKLDKVIYAYSSYDKGKILIDEIKPIDKPIDEALKKCLEFSKNNEMIPNDSILITVSGKALEYGKLTMTGNYILDNEIDVLINNAGNQHKLKESILRERNISEEKDEEN